MIKTLKQKIGQIENILTKEITWKDALKFTGKAALPLIAVGTIFAAEKANAQAAEADKPYVDSVSALVIDETNKAIILSGAFTANQGTTDACYVSEKFTPQIKTKQNVNGKGYATQWVDFFNAIFDDNVTDEIVRNTLVDHYQRNNSITIDPYKIKLIKKDGKLADIVYSKPVAGITDQSRTLGLAKELGADEYHLILNSESETCLSKNDLAKAPLNALRAKAGQPPADQVCGDDQFLKGYDKEGKPVCASIPGYQAPTEPLPVTPGKPAEKPADEPKACADGYKQKTNFFTGKPRFHKGEPVCALSKKHNNTSIDNKLSPENAKVPEQAQAPGNESEKKGIASKFSGDVELSEQSDAAESKIKSKDEYNNDVVDKLDQKTNTVAGYGQLKFAAVKKDNLEVDVIAGAGAATISGQINGKDTSYDGSRFIADIGVGVQSKKYGEFSFGYIPVAQFNDNINDNLRNYKVDTKTNLTGFEAVAATPNLVESFGGNSKDGAKDARLQVYWNAIQGQADTIMKGEGIPEMKDKTDVSLSGFGINGYVMPFVLGKVSLGAEFSYDQARRTETGVPSTTASSWEVGPMGVLNLKGYRIPFGVDFRQYSFSNTPEVESKTQQSIGAYVGVEFNPGDKSQFRHNQVKILR